jgi:hypothetical protein
MGLLGKSGNTLTIQDSLLIRPTPPRSTRLFFGAEPPLSLHCVDSCFVIPLPTRNMIDAFTLGVNISLYSTGLGAALRSGVQKRRQWRPSVHRQTDHDENGYYSDQSAHNLNCSTIVTSPISRFNFQSAGPAQSCFKPLVTVHRYGAQRPGSAATRSVVRCNRLLAGPFFKELRAAE